jgi:hypothetical protein
VAQQNTFISDTTGKVSISNIQLSTSITLLVFNFGTAVVGVNALIRLHVISQAQPQGSVPFAGAKTQCPSKVAVAKPLASHLKVSIRPIGLAVADNGLAYVKATSFRSPRQ